MKTAKHRRRLLFLAPIAPSDRGNGLAMRVGFFLDAYSRVFDVDLAIFPIVSAAVGSLDFVRRRVRRMETFAQPDVDTHFALATAVNDPDARLAAFRRYGRPSLASFATEPARHALAAWTAGEHYAVVHVSRLYLAALAGEWARMTAEPRPRRVIDCDEDDARAYRRVARLDRGRGALQSAAWAEAEADGFARLAQQELPRFDLAFAASAGEVKSLRDVTRNVATVPNVVLHRMARRPRRGHAASKTILFVGTMGYAPNDDAARWLVSRVWPLLRAASGAPLRLVLAGSNPSPSLIRLGRSPGITVTGTVPDIDKFYRQADLVVVPIRAGGGTRIKLLEAAAWGVPIVSTGFGADGTTFRHDRDLLVANNAEQFARACAAVLRSPTRARRLAASAQRRVALEHDAERWARRVVRLVATCAKWANDC